MNKALIAELQREAGIAKKLLERVPTDILTWKPHERSMSIGRLAGHIAEVFQFISLSLTTDELDFSSGNFSLFTPTTNEELMRFFDKTTTAAFEELEKAEEEEALNKKWILRSGAHVIFDLPAKVVIRNLGINHMIHHRGQLSVYLRLLNIPVPSIYGPSADEK